MKLFYPGYNGRMGNGAATGIVLLVLIVVALIIAVAVLIQADDYVYAKRGYGLILRRGASPPYSRSWDVLFSVTSAYEANWEQRNEKWPSAEKLTEMVPDLVLSKNQLWSAHGVYCLHSQSTGAEFLYSANVVPFDPSGKGGPGDASIPFVVVACAAAAREVSPGVYEGYNEYPPSIRAELGSDLWRRWAVAGENEGTFLVFLVQSETPPIPGCVLVISEEQRNPKSFYYPDEILATLADIYPGVNVPIEQIIHSGNQQ